MGVTSRVDIMVEHLQHVQWMHQALALAKRALELDEVPVGALLVKDNKIIGNGYNQTIRTCDPSAHAEMLAIRDASSRQGNYRLPHTTLYVTLEPCAMCAGAIVQARISTVVFGAIDPKSGACGSVMNVLQCPRLNHQCEVVGEVMEQECSTILRQFFEQKRKKQIDYYTGTC